MSHRKNDLGIPYRSKSAKVVLGCPDKLKNEGGPMVAVANEVGAHRYRESYGRYFEEFTEGDIYEHRPGRTVSEADNTWFTLLTMNQHPLHFDAAYASKSEFGGRVG